MSFTIVSSLLFPIVIVACHLQLGLGERKRRVLSTGSHLPLQLCVCEIRKQVFELYMGIIPHPLLIRTELKASVCKY